MDLTHPIPNQSNSIFIGFLSNSFSGTGSLNLCLVLNRHHFHHTNGNNPHNPCLAFNSRLLSWSRTKQRHPQLLAPCSAICSRYLWGAPGSFPLLLTGIRGLVLGWLPQFYFMRIWVASKERRIFISPGSNWLTFDFCPTVKTQVRLCCLLNRYWNAGIYKPLEMVDYKIRH